VFSDFAAAKNIASAFQLGGGQPGIAYGIVAGGELAGAGGFGERYLGGPPPDADTVFRIASMTKSFTASAVLALRDDGKLALDDLAEDYLPELRGWPPVTPDADRVSIRHLLTMTAGFPTDDPWGDRQQGLPLDAFGMLLAGGVGFAWAPGTRFEYSNLGYAVLGRLITAVTGMAYADYIRDRLLRPLGLTRTGFEAGEFPAAGLALGYRRATENQWEELPFDPCGAFAPMGGIFTCVRDLARWVAGFAGAFPPGDNSAGGPHPLRRATRREMQLPRVLTGWDKPDRLPGGPPAPPGSYGYGLFVDEDPALGRVVSHSGGYPGFGSNMRWHPATGIGVIALANSTYAAASKLAARLLDAVVRQELAPAGHVTTPALAPRPAASRVPAEPASAVERGAAVTWPMGVWPETLAAREAVNQLLQSWDDTAAAALFTENVAQDIPYAERRHKIALIRERIGDFADDPQRPPESDTPAHCRWWLAGERGVVQAQIQLNPARPPRVQALTLAVPPAPGSPLRDVLDRLVAWMNAGSREWPPSVPVTGDVDTALLARRLRMAAAWSGESHPGAWRAGDGTATATVELAGEHATVLLALTINPATAQLRQADPTLLP
jgi:CubicO group peptidase (beta-lactamase class C family)